MCLYVARWLVALGGRGCDGARNSIDDFPNRANIYIYTYVVDTDCPFAKDAMFRTYLADQRYRYAYIPNTVFFPSRLSLYASQPLLRFLGAYIHIHLMCHGIIRSFSFFHAVYVTCACYVVVHVCK